MGYAALFRRHGLPRLAEEGVIVRRGRVRQEYRHKTAVLEKDFKRLAPNLHDLKLDSMARAASDWPCLPSI